jgi:TPR repeat protein
MYLMSNSRKTIALFLFCLLNFNVCANEVGDWNSKGWLSYFGKDYKQAFEWFTKAAEQGHKKSQNDLGDLYSWGDYFEKDYKQAFEWFTKAAEQGHAWAQYNLAGMYFDGQGVMPNNQNAYAWSSLAAMNGDKDSIKNRKFYAKRLSPSELEEAQELATELYEKINSKG